MRDTDPIPPDELPVAAAPDELEERTQQLSAAFAATEVKFKPAVVSGNRALALPYVDARVIQDRLDDVLGVAGWQDEYECLPDGSVVCRLRLRLGGEWITKMDVGGPSEQPDEGDRRKAAFSDALKRAAVKFGVGRYLYRLPQQWVEWDAQKKKFAKDPQLPQPAAKAAPPTSPERQRRGPPAPPTSPERPRRDAPAPRAEKAAAPAPAAKGKGKDRAAAPAAAGLPASGGELRRRLYAYDERLADEGLCNRGDLVKHVVAAGLKAGHDSDLETWSGPAIPLAVEETKAFEAACRRPPARRKDVA